MDIKTASLQGNYEDSKVLAHEIAKHLSDKKAQSIAIIDISKKTPIADYFVICSVRSSVAVRALVDHVDEMLSKKGLEPKGRDMDPKWSAIDYGSVIMHVFYEETRDFYKLEKLWVNEESSNVEYVE